MTSQSRRFVKEQEIVCCWHTYTQTADLQRLFSLNLECRYLTLKGYYGDDLISNYSNHRSIKMPLRRLYSKDQAVNHRVRQKKHHWWFIFKGTRVTTFLPWNRMGSKSRQKRLLISISILSSFPRALQTRNRRKCKNVKPKVTKKGLQK